MPKQNEETMNKDTIEDSLTLFEQLPTELIQKYIAPYLSSEGLASLSKTSTTMFSHCQYPAAKRLLSHVVKGEEAGALEMIDANPRLLLIPSQVTDYSGRSYQDFTPFQAALLCHDVILWKKIEPYFDKLPEGQAEKARQFQAIFPQGLPEQKPYDFRILIQVISVSSDTEIKAALEQTQNDTKICQALTTFRSDFTAVAMKETFFNPLHLNKAFEVYNEQLSTWSWNQLDLFWRQVIGYIQRFLPACYAQAFCRGLYPLVIDVVEEKMSFERSLNFSIGSYSYYPLSESSGLGFDFGILYFPQHRMEGSVPTTEGAEMNFYKLCRAKQQNYLDLSIACSTTDNPSRAAGNDHLTSRSWCTIS